MNRQQIAPLPPMTGLVAGTQTQSKIISNKRTGYIVLTVEAAVTLAGGAATTIFNGGSVISLLDFAGFSDAGDDRAYWPAMSWLALANRLTFGGSSAYGLPGPNLRLNSIANGVYPLRETIVIPFAGMGPQGSTAPWETCHLQPDPKQDSWAWVIPNLNITNLVDAGGSITTPVTVSGFQVFDENIGLLPMFIPKFKWIQQSISGAVTQLPFYIKESTPMRGIVFSQVDSVAGIVSDIANSVRLLDDAPDGMYIGPNNAPFAGLAQWEAFKLGLAPFLGNSVATGLPTAQNGLGTYYHNWQDGGRLSNIYNPRNAGNNLRLEVTGQPSVVGGGSASMYAALITLESPAGRTMIPVDANGRPIFNY